MPAYVKRDDALVVILSRDGVVTELHGVASPEHALATVKAMLDARPGLYPGDVIRVEREWERGAPESDLPAVSTASHYS